MCQFRKIVSLLGTFYCQDKIVRFSENDIANSFILSFHTQGTKSTCGDLKSGVARWLIHVLDGNVTYVRECISFKATASVEIFAITSTGGYDQSLHTV